MSRVLSSDTRSPSDENASIRRPNGPALYQTVRGPEYRRSSDLEVQMVNSFIEPELAIRGRLFAFENPLAKINRSFPFRASSGKEK